MKEVLKFLRELSRNNDREWFNAHKSEYLAVKQTTDTLAATLIAEIADIDPEAAHLRVTDCTYRIYRDTRFSPDKTPYKTHIGIFVNPPYGKKSIRCGYYLHIEPGKSFICGGTACIPSPIIKGIRQSIYDNIDEYRNIVEAPDFHKAFPTVGEDFLKTAPKGFPKDWEYISYLRPRNFVIYHPLSDKEICSNDLLDKLLPYLNLIKPYIDFINYTIDEFDSDGHRLNHD